MKLSRKQLRTLIESIIKEGKKLEFKLPSPGYSAGVEMEISGKTTVTFARSASARKRFAIISNHPFTADGTPARGPLRPNPIVHYEHYLFETSLCKKNEYDEEKCAVSKQIVIDPDKRNQKFRVKSYSSR